MAALYRNITARKRAEEALRANEKRLRLIVENVRDYGGSLCGYALVHGV